MNRCFRQRTPGRIDAIASGSAKRLEASTHTLKGSVANFGAAAVRSSSTAPCFRDGHYEDALRSPPRAGTDRRSSGRPSLFGTSFVAAIQAGGCPRRLPSPCARRSSTIIQAVRIKIETTDRRRPTVQAVFVTLRCSVLPKSDTSHSRSVSQRPWHPAGDDSLVETGLEMR